MLSVVDELLYEKSEFHLKNRFIFLNFSWSWFHVSLVDMCQHVNLVVFLIGSTEKIETNSIGSVRCPTRKTRRHDDSRWSFTTASTSAEWWMAGP